MGMSLDDWLKQEFPGLHLFGYQITSPPTPQYNCIAWAAGENNRWWWPIGKYWPGQGRFDESVKSFVTAFAKRGYVPCESDSFEPTLEKLTIYVGSDGLVKHMARQLPDGRWTSKLGANVDIAHCLDGLRGDRYGEVEQILCRPKRTS